MHWLLVHLIVAASQQSAANLPSRKRRRSTETPLREHAGPPAPRSDFGLRTFIGFRISRFGFLLALLSLPGLPAVSTDATAQTVKIKLATLAPTGSSYHKSLLALRETWRNTSRGSVDLIVYADGKLGGEADTVNLMSVNSVQASMLTAVGLAEIERGVAGLQSIPMGFSTFEEVDYVGDKLRPLLQERLEKKGFVVLFWTDAGWVRFFAKRSFTTPDELKKMKLFTWAGSPDAVEIYKSIGFNPVPLETADILPGLQTGLIEAVPAPPVFALAGQMDTRAPHMLELNWAPLIGACVVRKETWERIPAELRATMLKTAVTTGAEIKANARKESDQAVKAMEKRGLKVAQVTPELEATWRAIAEVTYPKVRGAIVPADIFDQALAAIREYRSKQPK
jgi:TRAP-type C4-dicarboxylate transport system substrate-binding protein